MGSNGTPWVSRCSVTCVITGYMVLAGAAVAGDPDLKASRPSTGGGPLASLKDPDRRRAAAALPRPGRIECFYVPEGELLAAPAMRPSMPQQVLHDRAALRLDR